MPKKLVLFLVDEPDDSPNSVFNETANYLSEKYGPEDEDSSRLAVIDAHEGMAVVAPAKSVLREWGFDAEPEDEYEVKEVTYVELLNMDLAELESIAKENQVTYSTKNWPKMTDEQKRRAIANALFGN